MARADTRFIPLLLEFCKHARIQSKEVASIDERGAPLNLWGSQRLFLENLAAGLEEGIRTFYVLKSRQLGLTTFTLLIAIFWLALHPNCVGCIVADNDANAALFRNTLKKYLSAFPRGFLGRFAIQKGKDNKSFMQFTNGSRLDFLVAGSRKKNWGESRGYTFALLSEVAKYGEAAGLASFKETLAETHPDRLFIYESTANGYNHWRDMWIEAGRDTLTIRRCFIGFWAKELNAIKRDDPRFEVYGAHPPEAKERELMKIVARDYGVVVSAEQLAWKRWRDSNESSTQEDSDQNQPWIPEEAFVMTGYSFFAVRVLRDEMDRIGGVHGEAVGYEGYRYEMGNDFFALKMEQITDPQRIDEVEVRVWEHPVRGGVYAIGFDPAFGSSEWRNNHSGVVLRCYADKVVQVAEYAANHYESRQAAWVLAHLAGAYRDCYMNLELNGPGRVVALELDHLRERLRSELYAREVAEMGWDDALQNAKWYLYNRWDSSGSGYAKSFETTTRTKTEIMNQLRDAYMTRQLIINSMHLCEEMCNVVQNGVEIAAPDRAKDDRVIATALGVRAWINWIRGPMMANGLTYQRVEEQERGERGSGAMILDNIVDQFFMRQEARAEAAPYAPQWLTDRGFA